MNIPTEEQFEAAMSEIRALTDLSHKDGEHQNDCEFCGFATEMANRTKQKENPCMMDSMVLSLVEKNPLLSMMAIMSSPVIVPDLLMISYAAFMLGLKMGRNQVEAERFESAGF